MRQLNYEQFWTRQTCWGGVTGFCRHHDVIEHTALDPRVKVSERLEDYGDIFSRSNLRGPGKSRRIPSRFKRDIELSPSMPQIFIDTSQTSLMTNPLP